MLGLPNEESVINNKDSNMIAIKNLDKSGNIETSRISKQKFLFFVLQ